MSDYISPDQYPLVTWLTAILQQVGFLERGEVTAVESNATGAFNSHSSHLRLHYSNEVPFDAPTQLLLKRNIAAEWGVEAGIDEVKFYQLVSSLPTYPPEIVPCYAAAYDEQSGNSYILLQDLSETHQAPVTRDQQINIVEGVPSETYIDAVVDTLARLHAYWWNHPLINSNTFEVSHWMRNAERLAQYLQRRLTSWQSLVAATGTWFPNDVRTLYEQVFMHLPGYWQHSLAQRMQTRANLTLVHGDAYFANFLCPKPSYTGATYLLDWQSYDFDIGAHDLVNLCATFWTSAQRHEEQRERKILHHYHEVLQAHGVHNYSWDNLLTDYQIGLIYWLLMPVQDCYGGSNKDYWWPKMQCLMTAFHEWHCEELLDMSN